MGLREGYSGAHACKTPALQAPQMLCAGVYHRNSHSYHPGGSSETILGTRTGRHEPCKETCRTASQASLPFLLCPQAGFIGSLSLLHTIHRVLLKLREYNPALVYVCDPVQGDNGQLYVSPDLPPAFRSELTPIATIMTPNQLEAELLTERSIGSVQEALDACAQLHRLGPHTVVITSLDLEPDHVTVLASTTQPQAEGALSTFRILVPRVQAYVTGTGDLFTALLLGWLHKEPGHVQLAVEKALAGLQIILRDSVGTEADGQAPENWQRTKRTAEICRQRELQLVQHSEALLHPHVTYRAEAVP
ncbi:PDX2 [Auxenochlorella protothecoides x Auxenochlorella symbiontica]